MHVASAVNGKPATRAQAARSAACPFETIGSARVRATTDARTLVLADGREVRLAGIELPPSETDARNAAAALERLVAGQELTLKRHGAGSDRYGRLLAYVFVPGTEHPVQHTLLAQGHAQVAARVGEPTCAAVLLAAERAARRDGLGLWGNEAYVMRRADDPAGVAADRGRFALVEGKVLSVRESGGTIYVNFGRRWSEDFTVTVPKRSEAAFAAAGLELKKLAGLDVRVRGHIEERGGPWIEASRPEQIEIAGRD